jgi:tRNA(fMet)-specific endonuclease VapC
MAGDPVFVEYVRRYLTSGDRFSISMTVLSELYYAVYASGRRRENLSRLAELLNALELWSFDRAAAEEFGRIQAEQRMKGQPIPPMDAQIAAVARTPNATVLTADRHFRYVDNVIVENWLAA